MPSLSDSPKSNFLFLTYLNCSSPHFIEGLFSDFRENRALRWEIFHLSFVCYKASSLPPWMCTTRDAAVWLICHSLVLLPLISPTIRMKCIPRLPYTYKWPPDLVLVNKVKIESFWRCLEILYWLKDQGKSMPLWEAAYPLSRCLELSVMPFSCLFPKSN